MNHILVIDDDEELCELLIDYLTPEGFDVKAVQTPEEGLLLALSQAHDLVVLDVMLPGMSGFDTLRHIRTKSQIPVIMLTARGDDVDRIVGLEMGADDYLPKPFNPRELVARIRAVQRRLETRAGSESIPRQSPSLETGDVILNPGSRTVCLNGKPVSFTAVEFKLLHELLKNTGNVVSRDILSETVLGRKLDIFDRSIDVHVSSLRKKLGSKYKGTERIQSIRGVGYIYSLPEEGV
ncbi:response regulator transcription factor [Desulfobacula phenolica]|uniref:Two component transcriptional regulator, winged helix family n=1 Tax=Desulfobacula phenolica TaxID=90732 RepID=A0A1H2IQ84_9BACT|nr:response regulator transcription factor [Desulfobacula phenolica]SDU46046.1 two component transcriptional regulator, winged helix family [Desulfobacula phenolica]